MNNIEIELKISPTSKIEKAIASELSVKADKDIKELLDEDDTEDTKTNTEHSPQDST